MSLLNSRLMQEKSLIASERKQRTTRSFMYGLSWTYASVMLQGIVKLGVLMLLARLLSPREFGLLGYALLCASFIERLGQAGVGAALVQVRAFDIDAVRTAHILSMLSGVVGALGMWVLAPFLTSFFGEPELLVIVRALSVGTFIEGCGMASDATLQRHLRFKELTLADNIPYVLSMGLVATSLAYLHFGVWALVWAQLVLKGCRTWILFSCTREFRGGKFQGEKAGELMRVGLGFGLARLLNFFSLQGDNFVVGRLLGTEALGLYSRAYQLMTLPAMYVGQLFERVMFPTMARRQDELVELRRQFLLSLEAISLVTIPIAIFMYLFSEHIVLAAFGEAWSGMVPVFSVLSWGVFFRTAYKCSDTLARSVGAAYSYAARQALYTVLVVGGSCLGAWIYDLSGVACGVVAALLLNYISMTRLSRRILDLSWRSLMYAHIPGVNLGIVVGLSAWLTRDWIQTSIRHAVLVLIVASLVSLVAGVLWMITWHYRRPPAVIQEVCDYVKSWSEGRAARAKATA